MIGEAKNDASACTNRDSAKTLLLALERMQFEARHIHMGYGLNRVKPSKNIAELLRVFGQNAARVVLFMEALQPLVAYRSYHTAVTRYITQVTP